MFWHRGDSRKACTRAERMLADRSVGLLRPAQERWLDSHLRECASCRREEQILQQVLSLVDALPPAAPPPGMWHAVRAQLEAPPAPRVVVRRARPRLAPLAAAGLGIALAFLLASSRQAHSPAPLPTLSPESLTYIQRHATLAHGEPFANHVGLVSFVTLAGQRPAEGTPRW